MTIKTILFAFTAAISFWGCDTDSESDLTEINNNTEPVTYTQTVRSIINTNCIMCHATTPVNGAPMPLTTYADVKNAVLTRGLLDRISRPQGSPGMMPNGGTRLPQSTIDLIVQWEHDGLLE